MFDQPRPTQQTKRMRYLPNTNTLYYQNLIQTIIRDAIFTYADAVCKLSIGKFFPASSVIYCGFKLSVPVMAKPLFYKIYHKDVKK